jgi:predicted DNA-binding transcriptional regulator AlpA
MTVSIVPSSVAAVVVQAERRLADAKQVGARLGCSWRHVLRMADRGLMPWGLKLGALRRWDLDELDAWIKGGCRPVRQTGRA